MQDDLIDWYREYYHISKLSTEEVNDGFIYKIIFRINCSNCHSIIPMFEERERWINNQLIFYHNYNEQKYCEECGFQILYN